MPKEKPKTQVINIATVPCPYCTKNIEILKEVTTTKPAVKAEKEERIYAEKSLQTFLTPTPPPAFEEPELEDKKGKRKTES